MATLRGAVAASLACGVAALLLVQAAAGEVLASNTQAPQTHSFARVGLLPLMSPENSLFELQRLLDSAKSTLLIENQYIRKFDDSKPWLQGL